MATSHFSPSSRFEHPSMAPITLLVPDLDCDRPGYWQDHWQRTRIDCRAVDIGGSGRPDRNSWVSRIDGALHRTDAPVVLVGHGLGALAIASWVELLGQEIGNQIAGALLIAPRDPGADGADSRLQAFAPLPATVFPFPALVVASDDDPLLSSDRAFSLARQWGAGFARFDGCGDFCGLGWWPEGEELLDRFIDLVEPGHHSAFAALDSFSSQSTARAATAGSAFRL
jgi:predicted alpha/beta hydrolase family esterase